MVALVREENGIAGRVLRDLGARPDSVVELVERMTNAGHATSGKLDLTPRTKQAIEYTVDEAHRLGHDTIGTEHILLGMVRQDGGGAIDVFAQLGLTRDQIRSAILKAIGAEAHDSTE